MAFDISSAQPEGGDEFDSGTATPDNARARGEQLPGATRGLVSSLQGPTMGWSDEMFGALYAGIRTGLEMANGGRFEPAANYQEGRDMFRGAVAKEARDNPVLSTTTQLAASAPTMLIGGPVAQGARTIGPATNVLRAGGTAAATGAVTGAGQSEADTAGGIAGDAAYGAGTSAALGGGAQVLGMGGKAVYRSAGSKVSAPIARDYAREKVGEALVRDARGNVVQADAGRTLAQADRRMQQLGTEARIVDAGDTNTRALLDVTASAPGRTGPATQRAIPQRQAGRYVRLAGAADDALGTRGAGYADSVDAFDAARQQAAAPLYRQLDGVAFTVDNDLNNLLARSADYHREAERLARIDGSPINLELMPQGGQVPLRSLDTLKQSLFDAKEAALRQGNNALASKLNKLRIDLTNKLDDLSPKDADGKSIYKAARDAWAGPSSSISAAEAGRQAMKTDAIDLTEQMRGLSASELEAYRIGIAQSIKEMAGSEAGQTKLLSFWKNKNVENKLRVAFGGDYNKFKRALLAEGKLKKMESAGRGSQTAPRQFAADDLDTSAVSDVVDATRGGLQGLVSGGARLYNRMATPEPVRDEIGRILLSRGPEARNELLDLLTSLQMVNKNRAARAAGSGAYIGANTSQLFPQQ